MRTLILLGIAAASGILATTVAARTWHVPVDAPSIAAGVDSAQTGDIVSVACGTYHEHDIFLKPGIQLRSATGDSNCVTIDADTLGRVFVCIGGPGATTVSGLTIAGAKVDSTRNGGGVFCEWSSLRLIDCAIRNCRAGKGGGIYCHDSSLVELTRCHITANSGEGLHSDSASVVMTDCWVTANQGGGLGANGANLTLADCLLASNSEYGVSSSGSTDTLTMTDCAVVSNKGFGVSGPSGPGFHLLRCNILGNQGPGVSAGAGTIEDCTINQNGAGGMFVGDAVVRGTTIAENFTPLVGGGVFCMASSAAEFTGCIITDNTAWIDAGGMYAGGPGTVTMSGNTIEGNRVLVGTSCTDPNARTPVPDNLQGSVAPKKWTVIVFMNGDNDLEHTALEDIQSMASVGSDENMNIVVLLDRIPGHDSSCGDWTNGKLFVVHPGMVPASWNEFMDIPEPDMGDPGELALFLYQAVTLCPAEHYALIVWDHGSAWRKGGGYQPETNGQNPVASGGIAGAAPDGQEVAGYRGASYDDTDRSYISFAEGEFRQAFQLMNFLLGRRLDVIGFDTCLNEMVECANEGRGYCDYWVGSEELSYGFSYDRFLTKLKEASGELTPLEFARAIVEANGVSRRNNTLSCLEMDRLPALNEALDTLAVRLLGYLREESDPEVLAALDSSFVFQKCLGSLPTYHSHDLFSITEQVLSRHFSTPIDEAALNVQDGLRDLVIANDTNNDNTTCEYGGVGGVALYATALYDSTYNGLLFAQQTHWDEFLRELTLTSAVEDDESSRNQPGPPGEFGLRLDPTPFTAQVRVEYIVPAGARASVAVFDVAGRLVRDLWQAESATGPGVLHWDGRDEAGRSVGSGVYLFRLIAAGKHAVSKALLIR